MIDSENYFIAAMETEDILFVLKETYGEISSISLSGAMNYLTALNRLSNCLEKEVKPTESLLRDITVYRGQVKLRLDSIVKERINQ